MRTFEQAASRQYLYASLYTVWLVGPGGEREYLGDTSRKSGSGLLGVLRMSSTQDRIKQWPNVETLTFKKKASCLLISNGWRLTFGGTIRQESQG